MLIVVDGSKIRTLPELIHAVASGIASLESTAVPYFGFDLHSFGDCLHGGYGGCPPFNVVVVQATPFVSVMGHKGLADYCKGMLEIIDGGGRGLVQEDSRTWYENTLAAAEGTKGPTLLDLVFKTIAAAPASLTLLDDSGGTIRSTLAAPESRR